MGTLGQSLTQSHAGVVLGQGCISSFHSKTSIGHELEPKSAHSIEEYLETRIRTTYSSFQQRIQGSTPVKL